MPNKYDNISKGSIECWECPRCGAEYEECNTLDGMPHAERRAAAIAELEAGDREVERIISDPNLPAFMRPENQNRPYNLTGNLAYQTSTN